MKTTGMLVGLLTMLALGAVAGVLGTRIGAPLAPKAAAAEPALPSLGTVENFVRAIEAGDRVCGPVPFEVTVKQTATGMEVGFNCGRPMPVGKAAVPKPPKAPVVAQGEG